MKDLYKILSGKVFLKIDGSIILIGPFSFDDYYRAEIYGQEVYDLEFLEGSLTDDERIPLLRENGWWTDEDEIDLAKIPKIIEQMKLDYFNSFYYDDTRSYIKSNIQIQENRMHLLLEKKNYLYKGTCEHARDQATLFHLIENCSTYQDGSRVDFEKFSIHTLMSRYNSEVLTDNEIRQIAKSSRFRNMWSAHKEELCRDCSSVMKTTLINWAKVYDNVWESAECPDENIVQDDIALDGWFVFRRRKHNEEKKKQSAEDRTKGMSNANEIFMSAKNIQEMQAIYNMNSEEAKHKLKQLNQDLQVHGSIEDQHLTSVKQEVAMIANKATMEAVRKK